MGTLSGIIKPSEIDELAPMSVSTSRLCELLNNPKSSIADIVQVVELDQALTSNVLRLANSALSGSAIEIDNVKNAIVRLGISRIFSLAVAKQISGNMSQAFVGYELAEKELWRHSVAAALAAGSLGEFTSKKIPTVAFTAALLHDIGKLLLARHITKDRLEQIYKLCLNENFTYYEAEREVLGTDHAEVGGMIAKYWKFPANITRAIEAHHNVDTDPDTVLDSVHIANVVAKLNGIGLGSEQMNMKVSTSAHQRLGLKGAGLEMLCAKVKIELVEAEKLYGQK